MVAIESHAIMVQETECGKLTKADPNYIEIGFSIATL